MSSDFSWVKENVTDLAIILYYKFVGSVFTGDMAEYALCGFVVFTYTQEQDRKKFEGRYWYRRPLLSVFGCQHHGRDIDGFEEKLQPERTVGRQNTSASLWD